MSGKEVTNNTINKKRRNVFDQQIFRIEEIIK